MVTTITIIFFVSKLCHLTEALLDPNLVNPSTIGPNSIITATSSSNFNIAQPNDDERPPEIDSLLQNRHILRDKRNVKQSEKNFVRLGRDGEEYERYLRADKNLIRFGRNDKSKSNSFIRLGRSEKGLIRFGRNEDAMRFGRRGDKFIRFGRNNGGAVDNTKLKDSIFVPDNNLNVIDNSFQPARSISRPGRTDKYIRFGRGDNGFIRFGKRDDDFKYGQGSTTSDDFDSEENNENFSIDDDNRPIPMQLYYMLRKNNELPSAIDTENSASSAVTPFDDEYLMNVKLNYDKNLLKNNLL